jgi:hypothetical protein
LTRPALKSKENAAVAFTRSELTTRPMHVGQAMSPRAGGQPWHFANCDQPPFFVVGADRSGTTMLRLMLNRHPELAIPPESHFLISLLQAFPADRSLSSEQVRHAVSVITRHPRFATWQTTAEALQEELACRVAPTLGSLVDAAFRLEIAATGKRRWGDKTPGYASAIAELGRLFPEAAFIHVVRDGRDVSLSLRERVWHGWTEYQRACYWADTVLTAESLGRRLGPSRYLTVQYRDLVLSTEQTVRGICKFLRVDFTDSMLAFHEDALAHIADFERTSGIHAKLCRRPRASDVDRWKHASSSWRVFLFEAVAGHALDQLGFARRFGRRSACAATLLRMFYAPLARGIECLRSAFAILPAGIQSRCRGNPALRAVKRSICRV